MVRTIRSKSNHSADKQVGLRASLLSLPLRRQISAVILLLSVIFEPMRGIAQSKEPEKRGIGISTASRQTSVPPTPATPGDKPELILQTGHTRSANAVAFSPDNRWLASGGKDNVIKIWETWRRETYYGRYTVIRATLTHSPSVPMGNCWLRGAEILMTSEI